MPVTYNMGWKVYDHLKDDYMTVFGSMGPAEDKKQMDACGKGMVMHGRWSNPSKGEGFAIVTCENAKDIFSWAFDWKDMCEIEIEPVVDDNQCREIVLGKKPSFTSNNNFDYRLN